MPVGVVAERDIVRRCYAKRLNPERTVLESIMSSPIVTVGPEASLREAMMLMSEKSIRRVYVADKGKIIGRITQTGLFRHMIDVIMGLSSIT